MLTSNKKITKTSQTIYQIHMALDQTGMPSSKLEIVVFLSIAMVLAALFLNILNMVVIRYGKPFLNSTDVLQVIKTLLIIVTLLTLCPLDIHTIVKKLHYASFSCRFKGMISII